MEKPTTKKKMPVESAMTIKQAFDNHTNSIIIALLNRASEVHAVTNDAGDTDISFMFGTPDNHSDILLSELNKIMIRENSKMIVGIVEGVIVEAAKSLSANGFGEVIDKIKEAKSDIAKTLALQLASML